MVVLVRSQNARRLLLRLYKGVWRGYRFGWAENGEENGMSEKSETDWVLCTLVHGSGHSHRRKYL